MLKHDELERYIHENIPLSQALGVRVKFASLQTVVLNAPFSNNINHKKTVFGGSLHAVATLACWSLVYLHLANLKAYDIVITTSTVNYLLPVTTDFCAICDISESSNWKRFMTALSQKGKGRVRLKSKIYQNEKLAVDYEGTFAAIRRDSGEQSPPHEAD